MLSIHLPTMGSSINKGPLCRPQEYNPDARDSPKLGSNFQETPIWAAELPYIPPSVERGEKFFCQGLEGYAIRVMVGSG